MLPEWVLWVLRVVTYGYSATYLIYFSREIQHYLDGLALSSTPSAHSWSSDGGWAEACQGLTQVNQRRNLVSDREPTEEAEMRIWQLKYEGRINSYNDTMRGAVAIADTEEQARELAAGAAFDEGKDAWTNPKRVSCTPIGTASPKFAKPGLVLTDTYTG